MTKRSATQIFTSWIQNRFTRRKGGADRSGRRPLAQQSLKPRGLVESFLLVGLLYCVYAYTTIGAVTEKGVRAALGHRHLPSLFATFQGRDNRVSLESPHMSLTQTANLNNGELLMAARRMGLPIRLLQAAVLAHGRCDKSNCQIKKPNFWRDLLSEEEQTKFLSAESDPTISVELYAQLLANAAKQLGDNVETAVEALYVGLPQVTHAISQAEQAGVQQSHNMEFHAFYYSPILRRGPLQEALVVLTHYRLLSLVWPMDKMYTIVSPYGYRIHPILKKRKFHNGADLAAPAGTPVKAAHQGRVKRSSKDSVSGRYVLIDHGFGIQTTYCHLSNITVSTNQRVNQSQILGHIGSTGRSTGPHLHYTLRVAGKSVDPAIYGFQSGTGLSMSVAK